MYTGKKRNIPAVFVSIGIFAAILLLLIVKLFFIDRGIDENTVVVKVNNEPISFKEFKTFMIDNQAETMNYFREKYGADVNDKNFWNKSFGEEVPLAVLKQKTLDQLSRIKVQEMIAREKGLTDDISYSSFLKSLKAENKRRREALAKNEIIYGPQEYGEKEYFNYSFNNMVNDLKEKLGKDELLVDNSKLKEYYEKMKSKDYKFSDTIKIIRLYVNYSISDNENTFSETQAEVKMKEFAKLKDNQSFDEVMKQIKNNGSSNYGYEDLVFDMKNRKEDLNDYETTMEIAYKLSQGQISKVFKDEDRHCFCIVKCVEKIENGYKEYEEVKESVKISYVEKAYNELIDKMVDEANISIDKKVFDKIKAD
jgi:hypothetical protein